MESREKIIISGATGMIGRAIVCRKIQDGDEVTCIVHRNTKRLSNLPDSERLKVLECNLDEYGSLSLDESYDVFIHLAWDATSGAGRDDADLQMRNIQYTLDAVHLAHRLGCRKFIGAGSQAEYGIQSSPLTGDLAVNPQSGYGIAKFASGKLAMMLCRSLGMESNWVRILSVYGPGQGKQTLIAYLIDCIQSGQTPDLTPCEQTWDYLYSEDAAEAILRIADSGVNGKVYPLGSVCGRHLADYIRDLRDAVNPNVELGFGRKEYYPHQPMYLLADISELTRDTGWKPVTSFSEGIRKTLEKSR